MVKEVSPYVYEYWTQKERNTYVRFSQKVCLIYLLLLQPKQQKLKYAKIILEADILKKIKRLQKQHGLKMVA